MKMYRQGDVLITKVDGKLPEGAMPVSPDTRNRLILAEGEATGHAHAVTATAAALFMVDQMMMLQVLEDTQVQHEEHGFIDLDPGLYKIDRQREYSPEAIRYVAD